MKDFIPSAFDFQIDLDGRSLRDDLVTALSDAMFLSPAVHSAGTFSRRRNNTYFFHFAHQTKSGMYLEVLNILT